MEVVRCGKDCANTSIRTEHVNIQSTLGLDVHQCGGCLLSLSPPLDVGVRRLVICDFGLPGQQPQLFLPSE